MHPALIAFRGIARGLARAADRKIARMQAADPEHAPRIRPLAPLVDKFLGKSGEPLPMPEPQRRVFDGKG